MDANPYLIIGIAANATFLIVGTSLTLHFMFAMLSHKQSVSSGKKNNKRSVSVFQATCGLIMIAGALELILTLPYFIFQVGYPNSYSMIETSIGFATSLLHTFNFALIAIFFIYRLKLSLKGSIFEYSEKLYKILFVIVFIVTFVSVIFVTIVRINRIYQILNNTVEIDKWYFNPLTFEQTLLVIIGGILMYLCFQLLLVYLLANALVKVCFQNLSFSVYTTDVLLFVFFHHFTNVLLFDIDSTISNFTTRLL